MITKHKSPPQSHRHISKQKKKVRTNTYKKDKLTQQRFKYINLTYEIEIITNYKKLNRLNDRNQMGQGPSWSE